MNNNTNNIKKDINYLTKDFGQFNQNLINFAQTYFPNTYNDFNESDPGSMIMEMASYAGSVLSLMSDMSLKESFLSQADDRRNLFEMSRIFSYKARNITPASVELDIFQLVPSIGSGSSTQPDYRYGLTVNANSIIGSDSNDNVQFRTLDSVNFKQSGSNNPTEVMVYETNNSTNEPTYYLLKKKVKAQSGKIKTLNFNFSGTPKEYDKITISDDNIVDILDITDSSGDKWYEVPYLAQDTIFESVQNTTFNDVEMSEYNTSVPYLLKLKQVPKRFVTRVKSNGNVDIQFGSGISSIDDEDLVPNPDNVGNSLTGTLKDIDYSIDPTNFLYTKTYGIAPSNTTLQVRYIVGNGIIDNVPSQDLIHPISIDVNRDSTGLNQSLFDFCRNSINFINPKPASGANDGDSKEEIRNNAMANFASQNRAVTASDYIIRTYSLPSKYGSIAKAYITPDDQIDSSVINSINPQYKGNQFALNLYVLSYNANKQLITCNKAIKENLLNYLSQYRMLTDAINIKDAFIINIGIEFDIITRPNYNSNEVLVKCVDKLKYIFDISKWQINQPIIINQLYTELDKVEGVQTVSKVRIINKWDENDGYSGNEYDISRAIKDGILYPSLDPSIFEVKYPNKDILGRVVNLGG